MTKFYKPPEPVSETGPPLGKDRRPTIPRLLQGHPADVTTHFGENSCQTGSGECRQCTRFVGSTQLSAPLKERTTSLPSIPIGAKQLHPHRPPSSGPLRIKVGFLWRNPTLMRRGWQFGTPRAKRGSERFRPHSRTPFDRHEKSGATRFGWHRSASLSVYSTTPYSGALDRSRAFYRWPSAQSQKAMRRPQARQASQARRCNRTTRTPPQASSCHLPQP